MLYFQPILNQFWKNLSQVALRDYAPTTAYEHAIAAVHKLIISDNEQRMIDLAFLNELTQDQLNAFLQNWDIERYGAQEALLLAYVQKKWSLLDFGNYTGPRLKGLRVYYRFHNLEIMAQYRKIVSKLNEANIIPLIIKGGAMKHLRPDLPRIMNDIDILIADKKQFEQAVKIASDMGYVPFDYGHSVDFYKTENKKEGVLDIHRCLDDSFHNYDELNKTILSRAKSENVFGVQTLVPRNEDLVFIQLFNLGKNLTEYSSVSGIMYIVFDLSYLTKQADFDWKIVQQNMILISAYWQIYLAGIFVNKTVSGLLPDLLSETGTPNMINELNKRYFYVKFVHEARHKRKELYLWKVLLGKQSIIEYVRVKGKYQLLKHVWRSSVLLKLFFSCIKEFKKWNI